MLHTRELQSISDQAELILFVIPFFLRSRTHPPLLIYAVEQWQSASMRDNPIPQLPGKDCCGAMQHGSDSSSILRNLEHRVIFLVLPQPLFICRGSQDTQVKWLAQNYKENYTCMPQSGVARLPLLSFVNCFEIFGFRMLRKCKMLPVSYFQVAVWKMISGHWHAKT